MTDTSVSAPALAAGDPAADALRRTRLRRMKAVALGLLVLAAVVYVVTRDRDGFWGFVNAGAEASMVGAMADWFAVTALFRHPLGVPVPHTALIPRRKDDFGRSLEEFFAENFLQEQVIRERLAAADIAQPGRGLAGRTRPRAAGRPGGGDRGRAGPAQAQGRGRGRRRPGGADPQVRRRADLPRGRWPAAGGGGRQRAPRPGRPRPRGGAPLAGAQPGDVHRHRRGARAEVGPRAAQRDGHQPAAPRGGPLGGRHPGRPRITTRARRSTACWPSWRRTCSPTPRPRNVPRTSSGGCWSSRRPW